MMTTKSHPQLLSHHCVLQVNERAEWALHFKVKRFTESKGKNVIVSGKWVGRAAA